MSKQTEAAKMAGMERPSASDGDKKPTTPLRESNATEDDELIKRTQQMLDEAGGHEHGSIRTSKRNPAMDAEEDDLDLEEEELEEEDEELEDDQDDLDTSDDSSDDKDEDEEGKENADGLPDALVRSAVSYGWGTAEDVVEYYNEDPTRALEVFNNIYRARLQATTEYARLGQAARSRQQESERETPVVKKSVTPEQLDKLRETLGEDAAPLLDIIQNQQEMLEQLAPKQTETPAAHNEPPAGVAEQGLVNQQIRTFFTNDGMQPWQKVYGNLEFGQGWEDLTPSQQRYRHSVLVKANDILGGAQLHGRDIGLPEALEEAHLVVTQQFRDEVIVSNLKKKAVRRHRAISVKPSKSKAKKSRQTSEHGVPGKRTKEQAEQAVAAKMSKIFR
jgi:hypothetical protein